ncbi:MAG: site-specific integrase [Caldimonas sp.]
MVPHKESEWLTQERVNTLLGAMKNAEDAWYSYWLVLADTGMRPSEGLGLKWSDLDLDAGTLAIRRTVVVKPYKRREKLPEAEPVAKKKGRGRKPFVPTHDVRWTFEDCKTARSRRTIMIPARVIAALKSHRKVVVAERLRRGAWWEDHNLIFPSETGTPPDMRTLVRLHFDPHRKAAKLPKVSPYVLRHSHISALLADGMPVSDVSARAGHSSPVVTLSVYAHVIHGGGDKMREAVERLAAGGR